MATKRSFTDDNLQPVRTTRSDSKRNKMLSPSGLSSGSSTSTSSTNTSALCGDSAASHVTPASSVSSTSVQTTTEEEDESSSVSDDSDTEGSVTVGDEADAEYEEEEELEPVRVTALPRPNRIAVEMGKPQIDPDVLMAYAKELESKLHAFLPKLRKANSKLAEEGTKLNMEQVDDSKQHIEMNLDLGVLEQKQEDEDDRVIEGIRIPRRDGAGREESQLSPDVSVASLLNGRKPGAQAVKSEDSGAG